MMLKPLASLLLSAALLLSPATESFADLRPPTHHEMSIDLQPDIPAARIRDVITLHPEGTRGSVLHLDLHADFKLEKTAIADRPGWSVRSSPPNSQTPPLTRLHIQKPGDQTWPDSLKLEIEYSGKVLDLQNEAGARDRMEVLLLAGESYFYARMPERERVTFRVSISTPPGWTVVAQGRRSERSDRATAWESAEPMQEIILVADRFEEYGERHGNIHLYAFLKEKNPELAARYIDAAKKYLDFYEKLLGPYPYAKFALVENSRQTGWGMPSFTLLGSRIIRFPFILNTSYPHEILHNWWGNGVYVDARSGNWSEGLTAYLADHLLQEIKGKGSRYRFQQLVKFLNYVNEENDFPLAEFMARDSMASQAIGYGKTLMLFHMLRLEVGDETFLKALRHFYEHNRFRFAGFDRLRHSFASASGKDLNFFFEQWTQRKGAPQIELASAQVMAADGGHRLRLEVRQNQPGPAFALTLPVAVWLKGSGQPVLDVLDLNGKSQTFTLDFAGEPAAVRLDPYTDVFRRLDRNEVPPNIGETYGARHSISILPAAEEDLHLMQGYKRFARTVADETGTEPLLDTRLEEIPEGSLWIFGRHNRYAQRLRPQLEGYGVRWDESGVVVEGRKFPWQDHSFVFTLRRPGGQPGSATWVIAGSGTSVPGLMRKLPHYGKYGVLVFKGDAPDNQVKAAWPSNPGGLMKKFHPGPTVLPEKPPLVDYRP